LTNLEVIFTVAGAIIAGLCAIIWYTITEFIANDKVWKTGHAQRLLDTKDSLEKRMNSLELKFVSEVAKAFNQNSGHAVIVEEQLKRMNESLLEEYGELKVKFEKSDPGKVLVLEKRVKSMAKILSLLIKKTS